MPSKSSRQLLESVLAVGVKSAFGVVPALNVDPLTIG